MANKSFRDFDADSSGGGMKLSRSKPGLPLAEKSFKWPKLPGRPRKVHKPLGKRVRTAVEEDY